VEAGIRELRSRLRVRALYSFPAVFLTLLFFYPFLTPWKGAEPRQFDGKLFPWIFPHPTLEERLRESSVDPQMQKLGDFLRGETSPKDTLFVWGFAPEVYVRSGIRPASRYIYCNPLTGLIPWINSDPRVDTRGQAIPGSWNLLMADLEASKPKFIVDTSYGGIGYYAKYPIHTYEPLHRLLQDHYTADSVTEGNWRIYRRTS
ncbi:MAG TPA: hypothetical protein VL404_02615, partial [Candidatus Eisenbacteria bacterium]|nr:hypothetical protein [Candidatus Eisenbacteria bacterium]